MTREHYFFFDSRREGTYSANSAMAQLTNAWLDKITGISDFRYPRVWLRPANTQIAARLAAKLKRKGARRLIAINFGVGGNPRKRVGRPLEQKLLLRLLQEPNTVILLDKGAGEKELQYSNALLRTIKEEGYTAQDAAFDTDLDTSLSWGVIGLQTRIGEIASLIAHCDEYIGYDSACQHIAAALKIPCLTIFAGSNNMHFIRRWSAYGANIRRIVHVDTLTDPSSVNVNDIIMRIMNERKLLLGQ
jgi:ADP-heptose:LPS heptosyltransferase